DLFGRELQLALAAVVGVAPGLRREPVIGIRQQLAPGKQYGLGGEEAVAPEMQEYRLRQDVMHGLHAGCDPLPLVDEGGADSPFEQPDGASQLAARARRQRAGGKIVAVGRKPPVPGAVALVGAIPALRFAIAVVERRAARANAERRAEQG